MFLCKYFENISPGDVSVICQELSVNQDAGKKLT